MRYIDKNIALLGENGRFACEEAQSPMCGFDVLEMLPSAMMAVVDQGEIIMVNARARELLRREHNGLVGANIADVFCSMSDVLKGIAVAPGIEFAHKVQVRMGDGQIRTMGFRTAQLDPTIPGNWKTGYVLVFQDITDVTQLREERDRLLQLAAVHDVMPSLLHEIKNPLAAISTTIEVLLEDVQQWLAEGPSQDLQNLVLDLRKQSQDVPGGPALLRRIEDSLHKILQHPGPARLVEDLHAILGEVRRANLSFDGLGSVGRNLTSTQHEAIDFALREALAVLRSRAQKLDISLVGMISDMPLLKLDASTIRAITFNLVTNAIHACERGDTVTVRAHLSPDETVFHMSVMDTGSGMSPATLENCRNLFFTTKSNGSGIGLALCSNFVDSARGEIEIESEQGRGTTININIPLETNIPE